MCMIDIVWPYELHEVSFLWIYLRGEAFYYFWSEEDVAWNIQGARFTLRRKIYVYIDSAIYIRYQISRNSICGWLCDSILLTSWSKLIGGSL